jgi:hypothetical protein
MALEGFLQEFGLADILQLIYFQRKTGVLNIEGKMDRVKLNFINGNIVSMESQRRIESNRLGKILIKKGLIDQRDLETAIEMQKAEGIKLGTIFIKHGLISKENLIEVIQEQIIESIVQIFAWKEGKYEFVPRDVLVDDELPISLDTQHVLMDGLRIVDEWSLVEGKLDLNTIYRRARGPEPNELISIEEEVLGLIDGDSDVSTIINVSYSGDFETSKALISLEEKGIIEPIVVQPLEKKKVVAASRLGRPFYPVIFGVIFIILAVLFKGNVDAFKIFKDTRNSLKMERLKETIDIYQAVNGRFPPGIEVITDKKDPWNKPYIYRVTEEGFTLFSSGPDGVEGTEDDVY